MTTDQSDRDHLIDAIQFITDTFTGLDRAECTLILNKIEPLIRADERSRIATAIEHIDTPTPVEGDRGAELYALGFNVVREVALRIVRSGEAGVCAVCGGWIQYFDPEPPGEGLAAWWAHELHPADNHDAVPR